MVAQSDNEYQRQVEEVVEKAKGDMPEIPPFLKREKRIERVKREPKNNSEA
jgi:hypothetical protein